MIIEPNDPFAAEKHLAVEALFKVIDPELFVNVIDLGMVYNLDFEKSDCVKVLMTLTSPHCPMGEAIKNGAKNALEIAFPDRVAIVDLTFDPPWSIDVVSEEGKRQLGVE
ncbi:MAG: metal-sulfur cluster assembly factor [Flavobacteriales bacterium]|nr:metal-sulfur cluster assembly factor [Flavobacteriales bacterium]